MFPLLVQRNFSLLWVAHTVSILGDYVFFIAITFWIYAQTGSAFATGALLIASTVPSMLFAPLAGICIDRWSRRAIMLAAESTRALLFVGLLAVVIMQPHTLWPIYVVGFVQSALATFFWTARAALLPQMVASSALLTANALYMVSDSLVRVMAPALSAFVLLRVGTPGVVTIDALSFVISAGSICLLTTPLVQQPEDHAPLSNKHASATPTSLKKITAHALRKAGVGTEKETLADLDLATRLHVRTLLILGAVVAYTAGTLSILLPIFARTTLSVGPLAYGWILTAQAIGEGAMSILLGRTQTRGGEMRRIGLLSACLALGGLVLPLIAYTHLLVCILLLNMLFGAATAATSVQLLTFLQQGVANRFLGRALARYTAIQALAQVGGMALASVSVARVRVPWLMVVDGALYLLGSALVWTLLI